MKAHWDLFYFSARPARLVPSFQTRALAPHSDGAPRLHVRAILARLLSRTCSRSPSIRPVGTGPRREQPFAAGVHAAAPGENTPQVPAPPWSSLGEIRDEREAFVGIGGERVGGCGLVAAVAAESAVAAGCSADVGAGHNMGVGRKSALLDQDCCFWQVTRHQRPNGLGYGRAATSSTSGTRRRGCGMPAPCVVGQEVGVGSGSLVKITEVKPGILQGAHLTKIFNGEEGAGARRPSAVTAASYPVARQGCGPGRRWQLVALQRWGRGTIRA